MSDFAVEYGILDEYATSLGARTREAGQIFAAARVDSPDAAMGGGMAAFAARALQARYESATRRTVEHLNEHPRRLTESAGNYRETEDSGVGLIRESFGG